MKNKTDLSERLRQLRKNAGLSQEQLAEKLDISRQAVSKWEAGSSSHPAGQRPICGRYRQIIGSRKWRAAE